MPPPAVQSQSPTMSRLSQGLRRCAEVAANGLEHIVGKYGGATTPVSITLGIFVFDVGKVTSGSLRHEINGVIASAISAILGSILFLGPLWLLLRVLRRMVCPTVHPPASDSQGVAGGIWPPAPSDPRTGQPLPPP